MKELYFCCKANCSTFEAIYGTDNTINAETKKYREIMDEIETAHVNNKWNTKSILLKSNELFTYLFKHRHKILTYSNYSRGVNLKALIRLYDKENR